MSNAALALPKPAHSTGPITAEGKQISSRNSLRHGLTAQQLIIPGEDPAAFESLRSGLMVDYAPANTSEELLVERLAEAWWRRQRMLRQETAFYANRIAALQAADPSLDPAAALAMLFVDEDEIKRMRLLLRYQAAIQRAYEKAYSDLLRAQSERQANEAAGFAMSMSRPDQPVSARVEFVSQPPVPQPAPPVPVSTSAAPFTRQPPSVRAIGPAVAHLR